MSPPSVKTTQIYRGAVVFIGLQLLALAIAGFYPSLVNYLPNRTYLTSDTAPPPVNPKLQECLEDYVFAIYASERGALEDAIKAARQLDLSYIPKRSRDALDQGFDKAAATFALTEKITAAKAGLDAYEADYRPIHEQVRALEVAVRKHDAAIEELELFHDRLAAVGVAIVSKDGRV